MLSAHAAGCAGDRMGKGQWGGLWALKPLKQAADNGPQLVPGGGGKVVASIWGLTCSFEGDLQSHPVSCMLGKYSMRPLLMTLIHLAFGMTAGEAILLAGPTSHKSFAAQVFAALLRPETAIEAIYLTSATKSADLLGSINPFSAADLKAYCQMDNDLLDKRCREEDAIGTGDLNQFKAWSMVADKHEQLRSAAGISTSRSVTGR